MSDPIVADTGPLIGLARTDWLWLPRRLYGRVLIPPTVSEELQIEAARPGSKALSQAVKDGWLVTADALNSRAMTRLVELLDNGEAEAISLAHARAARLLIDERRGRIVARRQGVPVIGTGAVLVAAKRGKLIDRISPVLDQLAHHGYRVRERFRLKLLALAGES